MKMKSYTLALALLAISASVSAVSAWGETQYYGGGSYPTTASGTSPEQLAGLAAELAKTAAQLAEQRKAQNQTPNALRRQPVYDTAAARQFQPSAQTAPANNTVRWLGTQLDEARVYEPTKRVSQQFEMPAVMNVTSEPATAEDEFSFASDQSNGRKPASRNQIRQAQAYMPAYQNQNIRSVQHAIPEPADGTSPPAIADDRSQIGGEVWNGGAYSGDACCDSCCDTCCDPCCGIARCPRRRILVVGTEAVFLAPEINGNRASYVFQDDVTSTVHRYGQAFEEAKLDDFYIAPRLWVGVQGECWGVVGRYFHFRAGENDHDQAIPAVRLDPDPIYDQGFNANSIFEAYYADLEVTRNFCLHGCKNQFSFGVRYANIEHHESVYGVVEIEDGLFHGGARANRRSDGTGLTFGLNGRKPLFCNSCAHWFYNARTSILWGCVHNEAETWSEALSLNPSYDAEALARNGASVAVEDDLFIGEVQVGLQWDFAMRCLPAKSFFRLAFEYQYWDSSIGRATAGSYSGIGVYDSVTDSIPDLVALSTNYADAPGLKVDMYGFHVGTGFTW